RVLLHAASLLRPVSLATVRRAGTRTTVPLCTRGHACSPFVRCQYLSGVVTVSPPCVLSTVSGRRCCPAPRRRDTAGERGACGEYPPTLRPFFTTSSPCREFGGSGGSGGSAAALRPLFVIFL